MSGLYLILVLAVIPQPKIVVRGEGTHRGAPTVVEDASLGPEAYVIDITSAVAVIRASGRTGLLYAKKTLDQLVMADGSFPAVHIEDAPTFAWRGIMLDSARHYQPPAYIEQLLERMASVKLNVLHWHLTDDQGWRIQIKKYPKLTRFGPFYTQEQIRQIVARAAELGITIVPEIEMPGHATAAIAAYPALGTTKVSAPSVDYGVLPNLFNTQLSTIAFLEDVLAEVIALFPSPYIHIGGDEAEQARPDAFTVPMGAFLAKHDRRLVGWDEILEGALPADAVVMSWRGKVDPRFATVLTPAPVMYLDNRQSTSPDDPPGRGELVTAERMYAFAVSAHQRILGIQANLWTEHIRTTAQADRMIWPRAAVVAELGWSPELPRDWNAFSGRLRKLEARWDARGWVYNPARAASRLSPLERTSSELELCENKLPLRIEDAARVMHWVDALAPCWIWRDAPGRARLTVEVSSVPYHFVVPPVTDQLRFREPATRYGELEVRGDTCDGPLLAVMPLRGRKVSAVLDGGTRDLCMTFTQKSRSPLRLITRATLTPL